MAEVFRAWDEASGRAVAVKVLRRSVAQDAEAAERLRREGRVLAALRHPAIVGFESAGTLPDGRVYLVMELLEGRTLRARMEEGPMFPGELSPILAGLAEGLGAAHARGILHRDLKPDNVFLCEGEESGRIKVLDFGISKVLGLERLTRTGQVLGTPRYMAPEQLRGEGVFDERVDVYALGVVLYEALAGKPPFDAMGPAQLVPAILAGRAVPLRQRRPEISEQLAHLVHRAMATEPDDRFASVQALLEGWRQALQTSRRRSSEADPPTVSMRRSESSRQSAERVVAVFRAVDLPGSSHSEEEHGASIEAERAPWRTSAVGEADPTGSLHGASVSVSGEGGGIRSRDDSVQLPMRRLRVSRGVWLALGAIAFLAAGAVTGVLLSRRGSERLGVGAAGGVGASASRRAGPAAIVPPARLGVGFSGDASSSAADSDSGLPTGEAPPGEASGETTGSMRPVRREAAPVAISRRRGRRGSARRRGAARTSRRASAPIEGAEALLDAAAKARSARRAEDWEECARRATEALRTRASSSLLKLRGDCRARLGDLEGAVADYHRFCRVAYDHPAIGSVRAAAAALGRPCP